MKPKATVLLVDDDIAIRECIQHILLEMDNARLITAEDARQADKMMDEQEVDVLIVDFMMPGENGIQFLERIYRSHPDTVRILLSGKVGLAEVSDAFNRGLISRFILKPWQDDEELISAVRTAIHTRESLSQSEWLMRQYLSLKEQVEKLGNAVLATYLALRQDSAVTQDGDALRRLVNKGDSNG